MKVWAVECECDDAFYGWYVDRLYTTQELAEQDTLKLADINKGINYRVVEWPVANEADKELQ